MNRKIGEHVWFTTGDGERHYGRIESILPQLGGGEIYLVMGPKKIGLLTISEDNVNKANKK